MFLNQGTTAAINIAIAVFFHQTVNAAAHSSAKDNTASIGFFSFPAVSLFINIFNLSQDMDAWPFHNTLHSKEKSTITPVSIIGFANHKDQSTNFFQLHNLQNTVKFAQGSISFSVD